MGPGSLVTTLRVVDGAFVGVFMRGFFWWASVGGVGGSGLDAGWRGGTLVMWALSDDIVTLVLPFLRWW